MNVVQVFRVLLPCTSPALTTSTTRPWRHSQASFSSRPFCLDCCNAILYINNDIHCRYLVLNVAARIVLDNTRPGDLTMHHLTAALSLWHYTGCQSLPGSSTSRAYWITNQSSATRWSRPTLQTTPTRGPEISARFTLGESTHGDFAVRRPRL